MRARAGIVCAVLCLAGLAGCETLTREERSLVGLTAGAATGLLTAEAFDADSNWRLIAALAGAAAGTLVAQNSETRRCAYARGDGTYFEAACP